LFRDVGEVLAGARRFNEIRQCIPRISRKLLAQRLRELEEAGIVQSRPPTRSRPFATWLLLSHFAHVERPARAG
jgi:DNA-binding HxlR family transcriptional regulator